MLEEYVGCLLLLALVITPVLLGAYVIKRHADAADVMRARWLNERSSTASMEIDSGPIGRDWKDVSVASDFQQSATALDAEPLHAANKMETSLRRRKPVPPGASQTKRILIVDDNPQLLEVTDLILRRAGHSSEMALGGHEGMSRLTTLHYDLLIVDFYCGGGGAPSLVAKARSLNPSIVVILISSAPDLMLLARQLDADDYITKPYDARELTAAISLALGESDVL